MRAHVSNAAYGMLDYLAYPVGLLVVTPLALSHLGLARYGVWMFATAVLGAGSIMASGFGDANIRQVALARGSGNRSHLLTSVRNTMGIHAMLGVALGLVAWMLAPLLARHVGAADPGLREETLWSLRITSPVILVRALETVAVSTLRAFERYGAAIGWSLLARLASLAVVALPVLGRSVSVIMGATALLVTAALCLQFRQLYRLLEAPLWPSFERGQARALFSFGIFCWIQAVSTVLFGQADRLMTGIFVGAASVASYALCAQLAQPVAGVVASGLHFLFPFIAARSVQGSFASLGRAVALAFAANFLLVALAAGALLLFGFHILLLWSGPAAAAAGRPLLPLLVLGTAAQGISVTGSYTLLALGRVRVVTLLNLAAGAAMLCAAPWLLGRFGVTGMAMARFFCGLSTLLVYVPLGATLWAAAKTVPAARIAACEEI